MSFRSSLLLVAAVALFTALPACSSEPSDSSEPNEVRADELNGRLTLEQASLIVGTVEHGGSVTIAYEPGSHYLSDQNGYVPFLGVELMPSTSEETEDLSIRVTGNFPSTPRVLVTDESFRVVAGSRAANVQQDGDHVTVTVPASTSRRFVLVRDQRWVEPMQFDIDALPL